ncbi:hypothetical protein U9M48_019638, partial [Paspalum notatum var. saurae]
ALMSVLLMHIDPAIEEETVQEQPLVEEPEEEQEDSQPTADATAELGPALNRPKTAQTNPNLSLPSCPSPPGRPCPLLAAPPLPPHEKTEGGSSHGRPSPPWLPPLIPTLPPHHRNMKTECSYHKEDDPLLRSSIHALKDAMEVASLLLPLLSMGVETMESTPDDPRRRGKAAALWDRVRSGITGLMSPMSSLPPSNPRR